MAATVDYINIDLIRSVFEPLPLSARSHTAGHTNSTSFHIIKLPPPDGNLDRLRRLTAEFCIQTLGSSSNQAIWWTSYVVLARSGILTRGTGVYTEWSEFGSVSSQYAIGIVAPRTNGVAIVHTHKGVLNGNHTNGTVLCEVDVSGARNVEIFAVLVASGMHDGGYQVHGQARLEYIVQN